MQPLVEDGGRPIWSERLPVRSGAGAGAVGFTGESRDDVSAVAGACGAERSQPATAARMIFELREEIKRRCFQRSVQNRRTAIFSAED